MPDDSQAGDGMGPEEKPEPGDGTRPEGTPEPGAEETSLHGKLLFEDGWNRRSIRAGLAFVAGMFLFFGLVLVLLILFQPRRYNGDFIGGLIFGLALALLGAVVLSRRKRYDVFRIYENGMQFTSKEFVDFSDVDHIEKEYRKYIRIVTKSRPSFPLTVSAGMDGSKAYERVGNWDGFLDVLVARLKARYPHEDEHRIVRGP